MEGDPQQMSCEGDHRNLAPASCSADPFELLPQVAATPDELERTRSGLEDWAKGLRAMLANGEPAR